MAEIVGRKRTADGVLYEVRAIGSDERELTENVRLLLHSADVVCAERRARRRAMYTVAIAVETDRLLEQIDREQRERDDCDHIRSTMQGDSRRFICSDCGAVFRKVAS